MALFAFIFKLILDFNTLGWLHLDIDKMLQNL